MEKSGGGGKVDNVYNSYTDNVNDTLWEEMQIWTDKNEKKTSQNIKQLISACSMQFTCILCPQKYNESAVMSIDSVVNTSAGERKKNV